MKAAPRYPSLFQINTRVWLRRLSSESDKQVTLADIDDATIDGFSQRGFDWIWLLSVWQTGPAGQAVSRSSPEWRCRVQRPTARPHRERYMRLRLCNYRLHGQRGAWG